MKKIWNRNVYINLLFFILFLLVNPVYSEEYHQQKINILLSTQTSDNTDHYSFKNIINNTISFKLKEDGFGIIIDKNSLNREELLQSSVQKEVSFIIESKYSTDGSSLELTLNCIRVIDGLEILSTQNKSKINLDLDFFIQEAIKEVITLIKEDIKINPSFIQKSVEIEPIKEEQIETNKEDKDIKLAVESEIDIEVNSELDNFRYFTISTGFTPFMTTGKASSYFTFGMGPDLYAGYNFQTSFGYFGVGIFSSIIYFVAEGVLISSDNLLISTGPEIRLGIDANPYMGIFLRLSGGATVFMLNKNNEGYKSTIIPFVLGGMGITLNPTPGFGFVFSTNYSIYLESSILITGFSPSAGIYLKI